MEDNENPIVDIDATFDYCHRLAIETAKDGTIHMRYEKITKGRIDELDNNPDLLNNKNQSISEEVNLTFDGKLPPAEEGQEQKLEMDGKQMSLSEIQTKFIGFATENGLDFYTLININPDEPLGTITNGFVVLCTKYKMHLKKEDFKKEKEWELIKRAYYVLTHCRDNYDKCLDDAAVDNSECNKKTCNMLTKEYPLEH